MSEKFIIPPYLKKGDTIGFIAPARFILPEQLQPAIDFVESQGFKVYLHTDLFLQKNQFSGDENQRAKLINDLISNKEIKALWSVRGGYGTVRMLDLINFNSLKNYPKWICGFSDVTALHSHIQKECNMASLHCTMPIFLHNKTNQDYEDVLSGLSSMLNCLQGNFPEYDYSQNKMLNYNDFSGEIVGGNLSVLASILNSNSDVNWENKILFLEDLDEYLYHIDRMVLMLKRAHKFKGLKGLLLGSFIQIKDHDTPFGNNVYEIFETHLKEYNFPIIFDTFHGHHLKNLALPFGINIKIKKGILTFATQ